METREEGNLLRSNTYMTYWPVQIILNNNSKIIHLFTVGAYPRHKQSLGILTTFYYPTQ